MSTELNLPTLDTLNDTDRFALSILKGSKADMVAKAIRWSTINTYSGNLDGLQKFSKILQDDLRQLNCSIEVIETDAMEKVSSDGRLIKTYTAPVIEARANAGAPIQVVLTGHYDTVFPEGTFENITDIGDGKLNGPGLADMKGGIVVMIEALKAFETTDLKNNIGYHIVLTPDEETGNFASRGRLEIAAKAAHIGLTFEPSMETGAMSGARKGSAIFDVILKGSAAHAGRNPEDGKSAIHAAAKFTDRLEYLNFKRDGVSFNVGSIDGGGPSNIVPALAIVRFGVRAPDEEASNWAIQQIDDLLAEVCMLDGISGHIHGGFYRPPKPRNEAQETLFKATKETGQALGLNLEFVDTGGVCEGNNVFAAGTPNIDTLGVRGGRIHSPDEFVVTDSFEERASLALLLLLRIADGRINAAHIKSLMKAQKNA
ncbi:MAG: hydrolase [Maricaulaceae bacterium]